MATTLNGSSGEPAPEGDAAASVYAQDGEQVLGDSLALTGFDVPEVAAAGLLLLALASVLGWLSRRGAPDA